VPQRYRSHEFDYDADLTEGAVLIAARLWGAGSGPVDPFVQVASGIGMVERTARGSSFGREFERRDARFAPVYSVHAGLDLHVSEHVRVGALIGWTHRLLDWRGLCPGGFVGCLGDEAGYFSMDNAVWGGGLQLSTTFGDPL
jgi:hypothetical protein